MVFSFTAAAVFSCLACLVLVIMLARASYKYEKREEYWLKREEELRNQLWEISGGTKPKITVEREKVLKVEDPEGKPVPNWRDGVFHDDDCLELIEMRHGLGRHSLTPAQAKAMYPSDWAAAERQIREEQTPLRVF